MCGTQSLPLETLGMNTQWCSQEAKDIVHCLPQMTSALLYILHYREWHHLCEVKGETLSEIN